MKKRRILIPYSKLSNNLTHEKVIRPTYRRPDNQTPYKPKNSVKFARAKELKCNERYASVSADPMTSQRERLQNISCTASKELPRYNSFGIQMIPESLRRQLFCQINSPIPVEISSECTKELHKFGLNKTNIEPGNTLDITLPRCFANLPEFFEKTARDQLHPYLEFIEKIIDSRSLPLLPERWNRAPGWTQYTSKGPRYVDYPTCSSIVFDIEVCIKDQNNMPSLAVAISPDFVYSWVSSGLDQPWLFNRTPSVSMLIPLGQDKKVVVGHHVMYDRARVKEEYAETQPDLRFVDTQSLHVCVSGLENSQKGQWLAADQTQKFDKKWMKVGSPNSLAATHSLYCGSKLDKSAREVFVTGSHVDVQEDFDNLMTYCAKDVIATYNVLKKVWPLFRERFPSNVTLSGMFEMSSSYIPVNENWTRYTQEADDMFHNMQGEMKQILCNLADDTMSRYHQNRRQTVEDTWSSQLKWESKKVLGIKNKKLSVKAAKEKEEADEVERGAVMTISQAIETVCIDKPDKPKHYTGAPEWYRQLCPKASSYHDTEWSRGPRDISLATRLSPLLLRLCCRGRPLYITHHHGWGYLTDNKDIMLDQELLTRIYPDVKILDPVPDQSKHYNISIGELRKEYGDRVKHLEQQIGFISKRGEEQCVYVRKTFSRIDVNATHVGNVGNPLGKLFTDSIDSGIISSSGGWEAEQVLSVGTGLTFWRNTRIRILSQFVVHLDDMKGSDKLGVILPQTIPAGTITRRATEPLWLTASNVRSDRVGSEFKGIITSFPGYCFVGADVDSQELWIASLIGDSTVGEHGATPLGWMSLQGRKADGTDMHSKTAEKLSQGRPGLVSRDVAKAFNYARIYGAGKGLACSMLRDNSKGLSDTEINSIIDGMFQSTKGNKVSQLSVLGRKLAIMHRFSVDDKYISEDDLRILCNLSGCYRYRLINRHKTRYEGGSESAMFNRLEEIASSARPKTPCLKSRITRSLEPAVINNDQMISRINWVVQSSAVDFLHLLLVCMKWFMKEYGIPGRFAISIHDEVRFLVPDEYKHQTALALQLSNLATRAMFATQLNIHDLPNNVAFFSGVDIDTSLRKNVDSDCVTPSNPLGLSVSYNINKGEELDIFQLLEKLNTLHPKKE